MNFSEFLQQEGKKVEKNKGEHVFMQGDHDRSFYYVQSGLLKAYYTSDDGKEFIKSFLLPEDFIGSLASAYSEESCSFGLLCLEQSVLIKIPFKCLYEYSKNDLELANTLIKRLLHVSMKKEKREYEFLCLSAEDRFSLLERTHPLLLEKVTQNDLARYLGLTPVGLSRIKKRLHDNAMHPTTTVASAPFASGGGSC